VSYDPKVEAFMADIGRATAATTADLDEGRLGAAIVDAWNAEDAARAALRRAADERRRTVADTFAWAVEIVRRN
jgi:polysaccharide pyruvyl transferase WcaK-like protein